MSRHPISVTSTNFTLDVSGVAGFFGGDEAVQALKTIHLYKARRWSGWYNAPGSFAVAKCLGPIANSRFWNALFPGPNEEPEKVFGLDSQLGPKYIASQSGTIIEKTTHVAYLVSQKSKEVLPLMRVQGRKSKPVTLTVVEATNPLSKTRTPESKETRTMIVDVLDRKKWWASIPISASLAACATCGYDHDWYCFAMILLGIISNGLTCLVVGSASVVLEGVKPADNAPPGDGMLVDDSSNHIVILKGAEEDVNGITKGRVYLEYLPRVWMKKRNPGLPREPSGATPDLEQAPEEKGAKMVEETPELNEYRGIGFCALLLGMQSLLQLLLIPQGTLFGQLMFLSSFVISWVYNLYLSSLDKEKVQQELLFKTLNVDVRSMSRFELGTRTTAAVFATLVLRPPSPIKLLNCFLPNETAVWNRWREHVGGYINTEGVGMELKPLESCNDAGFTEEEKSLLKQLLDDAKEAIRGYNEKFLKNQQKSSDSVSPFGTLSQRHGSSERLLGPAGGSSTRGSAFNQPAY